MDCLLDLVFVTGRQNEGDTSNDDENKTEKGSCNQRQGDERRNDVDGAAVLEKLAQHTKGGGGVGEALRRSVRLKNF